MIELADGDEQIFDGLECSFRVENLKFALFMQYFHLQIESFL